MARCNRCNKFLLFSTKSGYCPNCDILIANENAEKARKAREEAEKRLHDEEEKRRAEEERRIRAEEARKAEEELQRKAEEARKAEERQRKADSYNANIEVKEQASNRLEASKEVLSNEEMCIRIMESYKKKIGPLTKEIPSVILSYNGGQAIYSFVNVKIDNVADPEVLICVAAFKHAGGQSTNLLFTRPNLRNRQFSVYYMSTYNKFSITYDNAHIVLSDGACRWYDQFDKMPAGMSFARLHPRCKQLDQSLFTEDYAIRINCRFLPKPLQALMFGNYNDLA